jgi:hypothetical protein
MKRSLKNEVLPDLRNIERLLAVDMPGADYRTPVFELVRLPAPEPNMSSEQRERTTGPRKFGLPED